MREKITRKATLGLFERYLTFWVIVCIIAEIALGRLVPVPFETLGAASVASVNIPVVFLLISPMTIPMLLKIDFGTPLFAASPSARLSADRSALHGPSARL